MSSRRRKMMRWASMMSATVIITCDGACDGVCARAWRAWCISRCLGWSLRWSRARACEYGGRRGSGNALGTAPHGPIPGQRHIPSLGSVSHFRLGSAPHEHEINFS